LKFDKFTICSFNIENLFLPPYENKENYSLYKYEKNPEKVKRTAASILDINPDICFLCEVGGIDSLKNFVKNHLNDSYHYSLIPGNSERGIELAYLVKKDLDLEFKHFTHKNRPLNFNYPHEEKENFHQTSMGKTAIYESHLPSRDIAELRVFKKGHDRPSLILLGVHLKSHLDKEGIDFSGKLRRGAELKQLVETHNILNKRYKETVPILLLGDFNGRAWREGHDEEFEDIYSRTSLEDILEITKVPMERRVSIHIFDKAGKDMGHQLDYIFMPPMLHSLVVPKESGIYLYKNEDGAPYPRPTSLYERYQQPSDHYPVVCTLNNLKL